MNRPLLEAIYRALIKARALYREAQPDAAPGECWAEFEALEYMVTDMTRCVISEIPFAALKFDDLEKCGCKRCMEWHRGEVVF